MTTLSSSADVVLLKQDSCGRVRRSPEQRAALLKEFDASGMSGAAFARHYGINYQTFASWVQTRRRAGAVAVTAPVHSLGLTEVVVATPPPVGVVAEEGLRIDLPGGVSMLVRRPEDAVLAAAVVAALPVRGAGC